MATFVIFVGGADTAPDPLPVFFVDSKEHAARICEGIGATEYRIYEFTFHEVSKSDLSKFPFWFEMTVDARGGIYGEIVAGIYNMIERAYGIIGQHRSRRQTISSPDSQTTNDGPRSTVDEASGEPNDESTKLAGQTQVDSQNPEGFEIDDKTSKMFEICRKKADMSWSKLTEKHDISERTVRRFAEKVGYDLSSHSFPNPSKLASALLEHEKRSKEIDSPKTE